MTMTSVAIQVQERVYRARTKNIKERLLEVLLERDEWRTLYENAMEEIRLLGVEAEWDNSPISLDD